MGVGRRAAARCRSAVSEQRTDAHGYCSHIERERRRCG
jgi:hypothetical protein